jgi:hypothetical protein
MNNTTFEWCTCAEKNDVTYHNSAYFAPVLSFPQKRVREDELDEEGGREKEYTKRGRMV